jgi:N-ethylmaleimide reductase
MGRLARPDTIGSESISSSPVRAPYAVPDKNPYGTPRAATLDDIKRTLDEYANAARNAIAAGFDGVQVHSANGYLIDQFLRNGVNARDDAYGGPPENRIRLMREVMERVVAEVGGDRAAIRLSPNGESQGTDDSDPESVFPAGRARARQARPRLPRTARTDARWHLWRHQRAQAQSRKSARCFGGHWCSTRITPRRPRRPISIRASPTRSPGAGRISATPTSSSASVTRAPLNADNPKTWYIRGPEGYTDYPKLGATA